MLVLKIVVKTIKSYVKMLSVFAILLAIVHQVHGISTIMIPVDADAAYVDGRGKVVEQSGDMYSRAAITAALHELDAPEKKIERLADAILKASHDTNINGVLLAALMKTESDFDPLARSPKGYKGLMQTPHLTGWYDIDVIIGARILKDKLRITDGNMERALSLYKGGTSDTAKNQARKVLDLYSRLKEKVEFRLVAKS